MRDWLVGVLTDYPDASEALLWSMAIMGGVSLVFAILGWLCEYFDNHERREP